jgi:hypothetical protein
MFHMSRGEVHPEATPQLRSLALDLNMASGLESGSGSVAIESVSIFFLFPNACDKVQTCVSFGCRS